MIRDKYQGWQDAEKVRQLVLFIWSIRSVWFVWLHETYQMDQTDQITRQTRLVPDLPTIDFQAYQHSFYPQAAIG